MERILVLVSLCVCTVVVSSIRQEIVLYEELTAMEQGNKFTFQNNTPAVPLSLAGVKLICVSGKFIFYSAPNFAYFLWERNGVKSCTAGNLPMHVAKSFRYVGASESTEDAVSLYTGVNYTAQEILIDRSPFAGITTKINSLGLSGNSPWTLFEGSNFDGKSTCVPAPTAPYNIQTYNTLPVRLNISTVGSLFKGCAETFSSNFLEEDRKQWRSQSHFLQ